MHEHIKKRLEGVLTNLQMLPSIPDVVTKIINMVNDPNVDFKKVADEISKDQAITTNILKLCNSAYFSKGKEIASLDRAIVTLGLKEVKDIIIVATTKPLLNKPLIGYDLPIGELWKKNLTVAMLSKKIAIDSHHKQIGDIVFTGGIIHDIGKTVLALYVANTFSDILNYTIEKQVTFEQAEHEIMGFDHTEVAEKILTKWQFPDVLKAIVRYHLNPELAPPEYLLEVSIVHIANVLCIMSGIGVGSDGLYYEINDKAIEITKIPEKTLEKYYSIIPEILNQAKSIM